MLRLSWLISIGISLFGVMVIEHFFTLTPEGIAGSGNLGAVGIALVIPFILLSLFTTFRYFTEASRNAGDPILRGILIIAGIGLIIATAYYANVYKNEVYSSLGGTTNDAGSVIYGFPVLNEYTNRIFINFYTFACIHTISAITGAVFGIIKPKKEMPQIDENNM
ncbi:nucleoside-diphosphate sugar epimerase [Solibacillus sp. CAU 1738]|uniref:nucleoside-diphosphate sugar epimerase n=1 Tax=Solibacillus sp. CAU 1738 TaxID=3140363 RepID=UPI003260663F